MSLSEIRIAGFGGQGVILAATIIGKAAAIYEKVYATMAQSYGPEARGGASSAQLVISDTPVLYPYVTRPDVLVVMAQEAYSKFAPQLKEKGTLLVEEDLVKVSDLPRTAKVYGIPATRLAEELGKKIVLNIVMIGFFAAITGLLSKDSYLQAIVASVPAAFRDLNVKAFEKGYAFGQELKERQGLVNDPDHAVAETHLVE